MRYEVGDKPKVKSWDKLIAQYGLDEEGWVDVDGSIIVTGKLMYGKIKN